MQIELTGVSNLKPIATDLKMIEGELLRTKAIADSLWKASSKNGFISPQAFNQIERAGKAGQAAFESALASSANWRVEQLRVNSATDDYISRLKKQKISLTEVRKSQQLSNAAYREQIKLMNSAAFISQTDRTTGKSTLSLAIPKHADIAAVENMGNKIKWSAAQWQSAGTIIQNSGKNIQWAGRQLTVGLSVPIAAVGVIGAKMAYDLDKGLTQVTKVYDTQTKQFSNNAKDQISVNKELDKVRKDSTTLVMNMAKQYGSAMNDTLNVEQQLAATGQSGPELIKNTASAMRAAMLGELDYNDTVQTTVALHQILGQSAKEVGQSWDYMNKLENETSLTMQDMATAIPIAMKPVQLAGGTLQDLGTLMTAMKAGGIQAAQGANAIKNSLQKLYNPTKRVQETFKDLTGKDFVDVVDKSDGIVDTFKQLNAATKDLDKNSRNKLFAQMFGSYQLTRLTTLVDQMGKLDDKTQQVSKAFEIGGESAATWAKTSKFEVDQVTQSISNKFKRAIETVKVSLATMGTPFLKAGTIILKGVNEIIKGFNALPGSVKGVLSMALLITAIAGPLIMLTGLVKNFIGTIIIATSKLLGWDRITKMFGGTLSLATKEEIAHQKMLEITARQFDKSAAATQNATNALREFIEAVVYAQNQEQKSLTQAGVTNLLRMNPKLTPKEAQDQVTVRNQEAALVVVKQATAEQLKQINLEKENFRVLELRVAAAKELLATNEAIIIELAATAKTEQELAYIGELKVENAATEKVLQEDILALEKSQAEVRRLSNESVILESKSTEKVAKNMGLAKVSGGLFAASIAASMVSSNSVVDNIANWGMMMAITLPLLEGAAKAMKEMAAVNLASGLFGRGGKIAGGFKALKGKAGGLITRGGKPVFGAAGAASAGEVAGGALAGEAAGGVGAGTAAAGAGTGLAFAGVSVATLGIAAAVAGVGAGLWIWHKHLQQVKKDAEETQKSINNAGDQWLKTLGLAETHYKTMAGLKMPGIGSAPDIAEQFKSTKEGKAEVKTFKEGSPEEKQVMLMETFRKVLAGTNGDLNKTQAVMQAFFRATGQGFLQATNSAMELTNSYKNMGDGFDTKLIEDKLGQLFKANGKAATEVKSGAENLGQIFGDSFANASRTGRRNLVNSITDQYQNSVKTTFGKDAADFAKKNNIGQDQLVDMAAALSGTSALGGAKGAIITNSLAQQYNIPVKQVEEFASKIKGLDTSKLKRFKDIWDEIAKAIAESTGADIKSITELSSDDVTRLRTATKANLGTVAGSIMSKSAQAIPAQIESFFGNKTQANLLNKVTSDYTTNADRAAAATQLLGKETALTQLNAMRFAAGLPKTNNLLDWMGKVSHDAAGGISSVGSASSKSQLGLAAFTAAIAAAGGKMAWLKSQGMAGMQAMTSATTSAISDNFSAAQDAAQRAQSERFQNQSDALSDKQQRQSDALDKKQAKREKAISDHFDTKIKRIKAEIDAEQKADDVRQKIFEAEQKRIDRLKQMGDMGIDLKVSLATGNLDEAARIQNDMQAAQDQFNLEDAQSSASDKSAASIKKKQDKIDSLDTAKQKALDKYKAIEEAQQKHLQKMQRAESRALQRSQDAQARAAQAEWATKQKYLTLALNDINSYTATGQKDLNNHIKEVAAKYKQFGVTIGQLTDSQNEFIKQSFVEKMDEAANDLKTKIAWAKIGDSVVTQLVLGPLGFKTFDQLKEFLTKGVMPSNEGKGGKKGKVIKSSAGIGASNPNSPNYHRPPGGSFHIGGTVGSMLGSRNGIPMGAPLRHNEHMIRAERGEEIINKKQSSKYRGLIKGINSGALDGVLGGYGGPLAMVAAPYFGMALRGVGAAITNKVGIKRSQNAAVQAGASGDMGVGPFIPGPGGKHKPLNSYTSSFHIHDQYTGFPAVDLATPVGSAVFAVGNGRITTSKDYVGNDGRISNGGYYSYGRYMVLNLDSGGAVNYAHLSQRLASAGARVKGGSVIARSGNTGHSTGPHLHFGARPQSPLTYLKNGGYTLTDGMAMLHKNERVLAAPQTKQLDQGIANFANGGSNTYNINLTFQGDVNNREEVAKFVINAIKRTEGRKPKERSK